MDTTNNAINRRGFLKYAAALVAGAALSRYAAAESSPKQDPEDEIKGYLRSNLEIKVDSVAAERIDIGSKKPAYLCDLCPDITSDGLTLNGLHTEDAIYFLRRGIRRDIERVADILQGKPGSYSSQRAMLIKKEYEGQQIARKKFIASNMDPKNKGALIWDAFEHEKQHESDMGTDVDTGHINRCIAYIIKNCREQREQETGFSLNRDVLMEERAMLKELLCLGKEYYVLSDILAFQKAGESQNHSIRCYREASMILTGVFDRKMQSSGIAAQQYQLLSREQIRGAAEEFAIKYHPDLLRKD